MSTYVRWEGKVRGTGTRVQILDLAHADSTFAGDQGHRWGTFCLDHGVLQRHATSQAAWDQAAHPLAWCTGNGQVESTVTAGPGLTAEEAAAEEVGLCTHNFKNGDICGREAGHRGKHKPAAAPAEEAKPVTVAIWGPNLGNSRGGEAMHVHAPGCADTKKGVYIKADEPWMITVTSFQQVVENIYEDMMPENPGSTWEDYVGDVRLFPCAGL